MSNPYDVGEQKKTSILGPTLSFKGELIAEEDLLIQGKIKGSINHTSSLTIGNEGNVQGDIEAEYVTIEGRVKGDVRGSKSVTVKDSANVDGNIISPVVSILEGSTFNGSIDMSAKKAQSVQQKPETSNSPESDETAQHAMSEKSSVSAA